MTRKQIKSRVQEIDAASEISNAVENLGDKSDYVQIGEMDIRLRDAFRRFWTLRRQVDIGTSRAANAQLAPVYTSNLQQLISDWA